MIDHRTLLKKYIAHVANEEGIDYIDRLVVGEPPTAHFPIVFTSEEEAELIKLADEGYDEETAGRPTA